MTAARPSRTLPDRGPHTTHLALSPAPCTQPARRYNPPMPTASTIAAARTALTSLLSLRKVTGTTAAVKALNAAIDLAIGEARQILDKPARRPEDVARRFGEG